LVQNLTHFDVVKTVKSSLIDLCRKDNASVIGRKTGLVAQSGLGNLRREGATKGQRYERSSFHHCEMAVV
jgi:hypothetical protein